MLSELRKKIDLSLRSFLKRIKREYKLHLVNPILFESIKDFTLREGKRIRPLLLILSYKGYAPHFRKLSSSFYNAATCMEFLHNFMLIHDDIIDRSDLRRGKPTLHRLLGKITETADPEKLGYDLGIIAGDIVYALAIDAFLSIRESPQRKEQALKYFIQTAAFTAMGEFIDIVHSVKDISQVTEKDVFLNYTLKTARYTFECPLVVGAILAGAGKKDIQKLSRLGILMGQAFQIQDDILGVFDSEKNIGKSILSDIAESKKTILICHAYHQLPFQKRKIFLQYFSKPRKSFRDLLAIREILKEAGSLQYSLQAIQSRLIKSQKVLHSLTMHDFYRRLIQRSLHELFSPTTEMAQNNRVDVVGN